MLKFGGIGSDVGKFLGWISWMLEFEGVGSDVGNFWGCICGIFGFRGIWNDVSGCFKCRILLGSLIMGFLRSYWS